MRRTLYSFSIVTILVGVFIFVTPVKAEILTDVANGLITGISKVLIQLAGLAMQLTIFALKFFIEIAGYNNYIDADVVQLGWNMVRDVANMFFVVVLLVIAFGTILGLEQYEWKKTLVKLVMAAFFVNFSNLICQLIIDVAQVFTITFLNAVAGAAGGNLIKMFNFDEILTIATRDTDSTGLELQLFGGAVMTITFAAIAMFTMGAYLFVMIGRMVVLWTLMILSPLAFLFSALPNTQSYAQEFWNEFIHHVIVAPVMVFFLWLAFATFGGGNVVQTNIEEGHPLIVDGGIQKITESSDANGNPLGASFSAAASWENMANFAVAIAFLWIGIERVQKLGVVGGGIVSGALSFGKNVATIASGLAAARWLGGGAKNLASNAVKGAAWYAPVIGGRKWSQRWENKKAAAKGWWFGKAAGLDPRAEAKQREMKGNQTKMNENKQKIEDIDAMIASGKDEHGHTLSADKKTRLERVKAYKEVQNEQYSQQNATLEKEANKITSGGVVGWMARRDVALQKTIKKNQGFAEVREKSAFKRSGSEAGDWLFLRSVKDIKRRDRYERGLLQAEEARGAAVDEEVEGFGKYEGLSNRRIKDGKIGGKDGSTQTVQEMVAQSKIGGETHNNNQHAIDAEARLKVITDKDNVHGLKPTTFEQSGFKDIGAYIESQIASHEQAGVLQETIKEMMTEAENKHLDHASHDMKNAAELMTQAAHTQTQAAKNFKNQANALKPQLGVLESGKNNRLVEIQTAKQALDNTQTSKDLITKLGEISTKEKELQAAKPPEKAAKQLELDALNAQKAAYEVQLQATPEFTNYEQKQNQFNEWMEDIPSTIPGAPPVPGAKKQLSTLRAQIDVLDRQAIAADNDPTDPEVPVIKAKKEQLEKRAEELMQRSLVGKLAYVKAKSTDGELFKQAKHSQLMDTAAQLAVWDKRGISTPTTALTPVLERYASEFSDMTYHGTVANIRNSLKSVMDKGDKATEGDKLSLMALFQHMFKNGWVDDGIPAIMEDAQVKGFMEQNFDWKDSSFDWQKINDIQAVFATGMNADFAKVHGKHKLGQIMDVASSDELGVDPGEVIEALKKGSAATFKDGNNVDVTQKVKDALQKRGIDFTAVTTGLTEKMVNNYIDILEQNQTQLQYLGSEDLKDKAIQGGHPENAGHTQFRQVGKKQMYIVAGSNMAKNMVFADANKIGTQARGKFHPHALANRDEKRGIMLKIDQDNLRIARGDILDTRSFGSTSQRLINERVGLASMEDANRSQEASGRLVIGGESSKLHESYQENFSGDYDGLTYQAKLKKTADLFVQNVLVPQLRVNPADFLMSVSSRSRVDPNVALSTGKINIRLNGKEYNDINKLIEAINLGDFGALAGSNIANFQPRSVRGGD